MAPVLALAFSSCEAPGPVSEAGPARRSRLGHLADPLSNCWHLLNLLKVFSKYSFKPDSTLWPRATQEDRGGARFKARSPGSKQQGIYKKLS